MYGFLRSTKSVTVLVKLVVPFLEGISQILMQQYFKNIISNPLTATLVPQIATLYQLEYEIYPPIVLGMYL